VVSLKIYHGHGATFFAKAFPPSQYGSDEKEQTFFHERVRTHKVADKRLDSPVTGDGKADETSGENDLPHSVRRKRENMIFAPLSNNFAGVVLWKRSDSRSRVARVVGVVALLREVHGDELWRDQRLER
jgi:hypothetical protein